MPSPQVIGQSVPHVEVIPRTTNLLQHQQSQQLVSRPKSKAAKWSYRKTAIQLAMDTEQ